MSSLKIKVDIITSFYNGDKYLKPFLENVISQTKFTISKLIIDLNMPSENAINLIKKYKKKYPRNIFYMINNSLLTWGASLNRCIYEGSSPYIAIWNIDDRRVRNSLELQLNQIQNSSYDLIFGNYTIINKYNTSKGKLICEKNRLEEINESMLLGPFFMFERSLTKKIGFFDEQFFSSADFDFALRLASVSKVKYINKNLGFFLDEGKGLSTKKNSLQNYENFIIYLRYNVLHKVDALYSLAFIKYQLKFFTFFNKKKNFYFYSQKNYFKNKKLHLVFRIIIINFIKFRILNLKYKFNFLLKYI